MVATLRADVARAAPGDAAPVAELVAGLRAAGLRLLASQPADGDAVLSPVSIALAFAMVEAGAAPSTADRIREALGLPGPPGLHDAANALSAPCSTSRRAPRCSSAASPTPAASRARPRA